MTLQLHVPATRRSVAPHVARTVTKLGELTPPGPMQLHPVGVSAGQVLAAAAAGNIINMMIKIGFIVSSRFNRHNLKPKQNTSYFVIPAKAGIGL